MADYQKTPTRFGFRGLNLNAAVDALPEGQYGYVENIRSYLEGTIQPREGLLTPVNSGGPLGATVHSVFRLNDPRAAATNAAVRVVCSGLNLYVETVGTNVFTFLSSAFSGNPLCALAAMPAQAAAPWLYLADTIQCVKVNAAKDFYRTGILPPMTNATEPVASLNGMDVTIISDFEAAGGWGGVPGSNTTVAAPAAAARVTTTIAAIKYDNTGAGPGGCTIQPTSLVNINAGMLLTINGAETVVVEDITVAIASTTIAAIQYDTGTSGLCTIQPTASLGVGQLEGPPVWAYRLRGGATILDPLLTPQTAIRGPLVRQVDFPVHSLIKLNGTEIAQILSVAIGPDNVLSFRAFVLGTFSAGQAIDGLPGIRVVTAGTFAPGQAIATNYVRTTLTVTTLPTGATTAPVVGGLSSAIAVNCALLNAHATLPDDDFHISFRCNALAQVQSFRVYLSLDGTFLTNYFMYEWRQSDIQAAVQSTDPATTSTIVSALTTVVTNAQLGSGVAVPPNSAVPRGTTVPTGGVTATGRDDFWGVVRGIPRTTPVRVGGERAATPYVGTRTGQIDPNSGQLAAGDNQWVELRCKVKDLVRIGTDQSKTLASVQAVEIIINGTTDHATGIQMDLDALYISGGTSLDVGEVGIPYSYCYRYRSTVTGAVSNPSPPLRGGVMPHRQGVTLAGTASTDPQVDAMDWFRMGGTLTRWSYLATTINTSAPFVDTFSDQAIDGGDALVYDNFPPWPTTDEPHTTVVNVAGTSVTRVSGDTFNVNWSAGSGVIINGHVATLYASPTSTSRLFLHENVGALTNATCYIPNATILGQALPRLWGNFANGAYFACGDPVNPGTLYWSKKDSPDMASDAATLIVSSASEPLMNGVIVDGVPVVFSSDNLYTIDADSGAPGGFRHHVTPCGRGLWTPWSLAVAPEGIYFLAKDGIYLTNGGPAKSITARDLRPLFPHDGGPGVAVNGILPPDLTTSVEKLRLTYVAGMVYFDYIVAGGASHTLVFDTLADRWYYDTYAVNIRSRLWEPGQAVSSQVVGTTNGNLYPTGGFGDNGAAIACAVKTPWINLGLPRDTKQFGDILLDANPDNTGLTLTFGFDDFTTTLGPITIGAGNNTRTQLLTDLVAGVGLIARNVGLSITWSSSTKTPVIYLWEPTWLLKTAITQKRCTDWDDCGVKTTKYVRAVWLRADTVGVARTVQIQYDGGQIGATILNVATNTEGLVPYAVTPFAANLLRIIPTDANTWQLYDWRFEFDEYPGLIAEVTAWSNAGFDGAKYIRGLVLDADTAGVCVPLSIRGDSDVQIDTISVDHIGRVEKGYKIGPALAHLVRIVPSFGCRIFGARWIYDPYPEFTAQTTDWYDAGKPGAKYVRGVIIRADTNNVAVTCDIQVNGSGSPVTTLVIQHQGEEEKGYAFTTPFIADLLRIVPENRARIFKIGWIVDQYPELTREITSWDNAGFDGAKYVRGLVLDADSANSIVGLTVQGDDGAAQAFFSAIHNGQSEKGYAFTTPFIAHLVRLVPDAAIRIFRGRWIYDKYPEQTREITPWWDGGFAGAKYVRGLVLTADTVNAPVTVDIQIDGGGVATTILATHNGQEEKGYAFATPFVAHLLRFAPETFIRLFESPRWIYDEYPELTAQLTAWDNAGRDGPKYVRGLTLDADSNNVAANITIQTDDSGSPVVLSAQHNGQQEKGYAFTPFVAHLIRLVPDIPVRIFRALWTFDAYPEYTTQTSAWDDAGVSGAKFVQGMVLDADTNGQDVALQIQYDGNHVGPTITVAHPGHAELPYAFTAPITAHMLRLVPQDRIRIFGVRWVFEPTPEAALTWITQPTTHDAPGFVVLRDLTVAYVASAAVTLTITTDGVPTSYTLPKTNGAYSRVYLRVFPTKGKSFQYSWTSSAAFQLFKRDTAVRVWPWGAGGDYLTVSPFGGPSRTSGAEI